MNTAIDVFPVESERLSAKDFLRLVKTNPGLIKSSSIVMPSPGKKDFGAFQVVYSHPIYKAALGKRK